MSLRLRLLLTLAPLFIIGLAAADAGTYAAVQTSLLQNVDKQLIDFQPGAVNLLEHSSDLHPTGPGGQQLPPGTYGELVSPAGVLDVGGSLYGGSGSRSGVDPA